MARQQLARVGALGALIIAVVVVLVLLLSGGSGYVVYARFVDAGQLVTGDLVVVGGHTVGSVGGLSIAPDGLADVELDISDGSVLPLRSGTVATIGELSLTGVANRFVSLQPGPGRPIGSGGYLPVTQTRGIVDLDVVLDALTPRVRDALARILRSGAYLVSGGSVEDLHRFVAYLNPAFSQATGLARELVSDRVGISRLVSSTGELSSALAVDAPSLGRAVSQTAGVLSQVAGQRAAVIDALGRTPGVLAQARRVLADTDRALGVADPALRALRPVAPLAATLLRQVVPFGRDLVPTLIAIDGLIPDADRALRGFVPVERKGVPALESLTASLKGVIPILSGLRPYVPDVTAGFFNGVGGAQAGGYDANGHYLRSRIVLSGGGSSFSGLLSVLGDATLKLPDLTGTRTELLSPCPGGGSPSAPDGSNPWTNPDTLKGAGVLCNPADDQR